ncbi:hypothetical protein [Nocardia sp. NPDC024068]|uniref:hypothetical protein n=1 Tax=Nocardia sp. NPDC024068 TaxID=3157197 RepID=UPI0033FE1187
MGTAPAVTPERTSAPKPSSAPRSGGILSLLRGGHPARTVIVIALVGIAAQLVLRGLVLAHGYFYWDDLILAGRAGSLPLYAPELLLHEHDGHFMPLAFAVSWLVTAIAPLEWGAAAAVTLLMQAAASLAVLRLLLVLLGPRRTMLVPLLFYLFGPLTLPAFAWWSAALNALPLQFALAWVAADALRLDRTGARRYAVSGVLVSAVALLFFEKAVVVPFVAFAVVVLARYVDGRGPGFRAVLRRGSVLWAGAAVVLAGWAVAYYAVVGLTHGEGGSGDIASMLPRAAWAGVVTALLGGPWGWERWVPSAPWAVAPDWTVWAAWGLVLVAVVWTIRARRVVWPVWVAAAVYLPAVQIPVVLMRAGPNTVDELMMSLRYLADASVVLTAAGALLLRAFAPTGTGVAGPGGEAEPARAAGAPATWWRGPLPVAAVAVAVAFVLSSLWSTYSFTRIWSESPTKTYVTNATAEFARWDGAPLLEQEVPWTVLNPTAYPDNEASRVLSPVTPPGAFAEATGHLRMITDTGEFAEARVWWNRGIEPGPDPGCGYRIAGGAPVRLALDGPMIAHEWTAQLNYFADRDGEIAVGFDSGHKAAVPLRAGLNTVYVRIAGSGSALLVQSRTPGLQVCIGTGPVGVASHE